MTTDIQPTSRAIVSQGLTLNYLDWGNAGAPTLILMHGMYDHAHSWDWVARAICGKWHVIAPDLRGHGDSQWSPDGAYHLPCYLEDFVELVDTLGRGPVSIVAHSMGGNPAARFAALYPARVSKLVLVDAMGPMASVLARWDQQGVISRSREWLERRRETATKPPRRFASMDECVARMASANSHLSAAQARYLAEHGARRFDNAYGWKYDPAVGNLLPEDFAFHLADYWREISAETLLCWGPNGWTTNPSTDGTAACFRNHQSAVFENAGHWIHHDQLDDFVAALQAFLAAP